MNDIKQPEALRLARELEGVYPVNIEDQKAAAAELRRLHMYAAGADQLVDVWKGRAQDFMNSRDRLLKANRSLWDKMDSLRAGPSQPAVCGQWICEYPCDVFVVFDPTTDGAHIIGAARTLREAWEILDTVWQEPPAAAELRRLHAELNDVQDQRREAFRAIERLNDELGQAREQRDGLLSALRMARNNIQADRDVLLECCARPDGSLAPEDAELLAVVDGKLAQIDAAIAKAGGAA